jgi:hypothetical protein
VKREREEGKEKKLGRSRVRMHKIIGAENLKSKQKEEGGGRRWIDR